MPTALNTFLALSILASIQPGSPLRGDTQVGMDISLQLSNGTGDGQADKVHYQQYSLGSLANTTLDLVGGVTDPYGVACNFAKIKLLCMWNLETTDGRDLMWGPNAATGFGIAGWLSAVAGRRRCNAGSAANPYGMDFWFDPNGIACAGGASDLIYIENLVASTTNYKVLIIGTSV